MSQGHQAYIRTRDCPGTNMEDSQAYYMPSSLRLSCEIMCPWVVYHVLQKSVWGLDHRPKY